MTPRFFTSVCTSASHATSCAVVHWCGPMAPTAEAEAAEDVADVEEEEELAGVAAAPADADVPPAACDNDGKQSRSPVIQ